MLLIGLIAVAIAASGLRYRVHVELEPLARLPGYRRMLLAAALGSGVLAFALQPLISINVVRFPRCLIDPFIRRARVPRHR